MSDDATLLRQYADTRSEEAFAEFVHRHLGQVYATALRRTGGNTHRAQEIAQLVFTRIAQNPVPVARHPVIAAWLHTATRYAAANLLRSEQRRQTRETISHDLTSMHDDPAGPADWEKLRPELDASIDKLNDADRAAIILRFFENKSFAAIGDLLRLSEEAAQKRTHRALEKLRTSLVRRGVTSTSAALGAVLTQHVSAAVIPQASLVTSITATALSASTPAALGGIAAILTMTKLQTGAVLAVALIASVGSISYTLSKQRDHTQELTELRTQNHQQLTQLKNENAKLQRELETLAGTPESTTVSSPIAAAPPPPPLPPKDIYKQLIMPEDCRNVGGASMGTAFETMMWAAVKGDVDTLAGLITPDQDATEILAAFHQTLSPQLRQKFPTPNHLMAYWMSDEVLRKAHSVQILGVEQTGPAHGKIRMLMTKVGSEDDPAERSATLAYNGVNWGWPMNKDLTENAINRLKRKLKIDPTAGLAR